MTLVVSPVAPLDLPALYDLLRAKAHFDGVPDALKATMESMSDCLFSPQPRMKAIVARANQEVVGMATFCDIFSSFTMKPGLWLDDLYVREDQRKSGIGRALLAWLCSEAIDKGCTRIDWVVATQNTNGREFYATLGAAIFDEVRFARFDDAAIHHIVASGHERGLSG